MSDYGWFTRLRLRLADKIVGKRTVLFTSRRNIGFMETGDYLKLPDDVLGAVTRRWFDAIEAVHAKRARKDGRPVSVMVTQHAVLALATHCAEANAETGDFTIRGSIDGGRTERVYRAVVSILPDDFDFEAGVRKEYGDPEKPDAITKLTLGFDFHDTYERWKAERAAARGSAA